jgi:hypothetical protein
MLCINKHKLVLRPVKAKTYVNLINCRHIRGKVLIALADGTVAIFRRKPGMLTFCMLTFSISLLVAASGGSSSLFVHIYNFNRAHIFVSSTILTQRLKSSDVPYFTLILFEQFTAEKSLYILIINSL